MIEHLRQDLSPLLPIVLDRTTILQQSHLPPQVRLIGERAEWMETLKGPAMALLARLSAEEGEVPSLDRTRIAKALSDAEVEPLRKVAQTLCSILASASQKNLHVGVGLTIPHWQHSTTLKLLGSDEESVAVALARFVSQIPEVEVAISEEIKGPHRPYGQVQLEVSENGPILLRWLDEKDLSYHQRELKPHGAPGATKTPASGEG